MTKGTVSLTPRRVARVSSPQQTKHSYQVFEELEDGSWKSVSKEYDHSTSAFAALGRLVQKETLQMIGAPLHESITK